MPITRWGSDTTFVWCSRKSCLTPKKNGWGGRDRTYECRNQHPVPYHLATPQRSFERRWRNPLRVRSSTRLFRRLRECAQRMACERANDASFDLLRQMPQRLVRFICARERCKHATARSGHPRIRRCLRKRSSRFANRGKTRRRGGLEVVASVTLGKDVHFR